MRSGRPCKHCGGWENNARIYLNNEALVEWQRLRNEQDLTSNNKFQLDLFWTQYRFVFNIII